MKKTALVHQKINEAMPNPSSVPDKLKMSHETADALRQAFIDDGFGDVFSINPPRAPGAVTFVWGFDVFVDDSIPYSHIDVSFADAFVGSYI